MEKRYRKALNFDLDTKSLKMYYPKQNYKQAYYDLGKVLKKLGFEHRQGSGYVSEQKLLSKEVFDIVENINKKCPWLSKCVNRFDVTDVGVQYDLTEFIRMDADIIQNKEARTKGKETKESVLGKLRKNKETITNDAKSGVDREYSVKENERSIR